MTHASPGMETSTGFSQAGIKLRRYKGVINVRHMVPYEQQTG